MIVRPETIARACAGAIVLISILIPFAVITYAAGAAASMAWRHRRPGKQAP